MPFRSSKRWSKRQAREQPPSPGCFSSLGKRNGHDTSWTHSESSMDEERRAPLSSIDATPPRPQRPKQPYHPTSLGDDISPIHVGESVSNGSTRRRSNRSGFRTYVPPRGGSGSVSSHTAGLQSIHVDYSNPEELDLLLDTMSLANKSGDEGNNPPKEKQKKGRYLLGKSKRNKSIGRDGKQQRKYKHIQEKDDPIIDMCNFRAHDSDIDAASEVLINFLVSDLSLNFAGALTSTAVGLCLLAPSKPEDTWNHPPERMVQESLTRHMQVCLDSHSDCNKTACTGTSFKSLPVDLDTGFFLQTDCDAVNEMALRHLQEGEPEKAVEIFRVLLQNQRKERGTSCRVAEESEIANTKSRLAILSLITQNKRDAWQYATSALQTHKKAARPVHTTLSTMELGLVYFGSEQLSQALQCWREALQLACMSLGYDHFQVTVLLSNLGCLHYYMGNFQASCTALEESLGLQRQMLRSNDHCANVELPLFQMATTMANLALIMARCESYDSAVSLMEEALAIQESVLVRSDNVKIVSEQYIEMFTQLRDAEESVADTGEGKQNSSSKSVSTLNSLIPQPLSIFGDSDGIPRLHDGSKHFHVASSRSATIAGEEDPSYDCILLGSLVKLATAKQRVHSTVVQSLESAARRLPDPARCDFTNDDGATIPSKVPNRKKHSIPVDLDGETVIDAEFHLGEINLQALDHLSRNEFKDALDLFESALRSHKNKYGDIHHLCGTGLHNCGIVHMAAEQYIQGKLCFQEAASVRTAALGETHPDVATSKFKIGMIQMAGGDYKCALSTFMDIVFQLQTNMSCYGFAPEAKMLNNIGVVLYEMGRDVDAYQSFFKAYQIQKGLIKDTNCAPAERSLASTLSNLGFIYAMQGQYSDSLGSYEEALGILKKYYPTDHSSVVTLEENVAHVKAYGAKDPQEAGHYVQSDVFASCAHLEEEGAKRVAAGQSKFTACFSSFPS